jgi:hypothetical protein
LAAGELLAEYPFPPGWRAAIDQARQRVAVVDSIETALTDANVHAFVEHFDARLIRQFPDRFQSHQAALLKWIESEILAADVMGLVPAVGRASLAEVEGQKGDYRVRWTWPLPRFAEECFVAVVKTKPGVCDTPDDVSVLYQQALDRTAWEAAGGSRTLEADPAWEGAYAVAWARVDIGLRQYWSEPLVLGQLENIPARSKDSPRRWRLFGTARNGADADAPAEPPQQEPAAELEPEDEQG